MSDTDQHDLTEPTEDHVADAGDDWVDDYWDDEDELYVNLPEEGGWVRKVALILVTLVLLIGGVFGAAWVWLNRQLDPPGEPGTTEITIEVPEGATTSQIARILEEQEVVSSATIFRLYADWKDSPQFQAGEYDGFYTNSDMDAVLARLEQGPLPPTYRPVTVPEGLWLSDIVPVILTAYPEMDPNELTSSLGEARSKYQPPEINTLEGLLFPDTYQVEEDQVTDERTLIGQMVTAMDKNMDELGYADSQALVGLDPYQVLVVASLVEEEAKTDVDRPMIARVIYNRLAADMKLEIDATVPYALGMHKTELTKTDLAVDSPYNTRKFPGLPPTPIAAPGRASLDAALHPAEGPWLYYVLKDAEGNHFFTDNYDEFLDAKNAAQEAGLF